MSLQLLLEEFMIVELVTRRDLQSSGQHALMHPGRALQLQFIAAPVRDASDCAVLAVWMSVDDQSQPTSLICCELNVRLSG